MAFRLANVNDRAALVDGDVYFDLEAVSDGALGHDPMAALDDAEALHALGATLTDREPTGRLADVSLGAPVPRPQKSFGIGLNYLDHAAESKMELPENPLVFTKFPSCLVGPTATVEMRSAFVDYEGELVVVIGKGGKDIAAADAWDHVIGVTGGQDISDRKAQFAAKPPHFDLGKSFDTFGPIGPDLVSIDQVDAENLRVVTKVNGEVRQDDTTASLIFGIPKLIEYLSHITTLVTGDLIFTGTPSGVGAAAGRYLVEGDVIVTEIEGIGTLENHCVML